MIDVKHFLVKPANDENDEVLSFDTLTPLSYSISWLLVCIYESDSYVLR